MPLRRIDSLLAKLNHSNLYDMEHVHYLSNGLDVAHHLATAQGVKGGSNMEPPNEYRRVSFTYSRSRWLNSAIESTAAMLVN